MNTAAFLNRNMEDAVESVRDAIRADLSRAVSRDTCIGSAPLHDGEDRGFGQVVRLPSWQSRRRAGAGVW